MSNLYTYKDKDFFLSHTIDQAPRPDAFAMHTHTTTELYYFANGKGIYHIEGSAYPLEKGDLLIMHPSESHYIEIDPSCPYERKVLNFNSELFATIDPENLLMKAVLNRKSGKFNLYRASQFQRGSCEHYWQTMMSREGDARLNILAGLVPMLGEVYRIYCSNVTAEDSEPDTVEYQIIRYVNSNLAKPVSLDEICNRFFISKSQLCRLFKKATGTTVWQYVTIKRLVKAHQLLQAGENPTHVYARCGFNDYSTFYRAYTRHYGTAPRNTL